MRQRLAQLYQQRNSYRRVFVHRTRRWYQLRRRRAYGRWKAADARFGNLPSHTLHTLHRINDHWRRDAATLAYWSFFCLFPFITLTTMIMSSLSSLWRIRMIMALTLEYVLPFNELKVVQESAATILSRPLLYSAISVIGLVLSLVGWLTELQNIISRIFGDTRKRKWYWQFLRQIGLLASGTTTFIISALLLAKLKEMRIYWPGSRVEITMAVGLIGASLIQFAAFVAIYRLIPIRRVRWTATLLCCIFITLIWNVSRLTFDVFTRKVANYTGLYGSVGVVIGLLVWFFFISCLLCIGGEAIVGVHEWLDGLPRNVLPPCPPMISTVQRTDD